MISIALTSYNGEKYIREQLDSILNQTIQDFEVVVCDDVSKDNTWNILQEYQQRDSRFRIFSNEQNLGFKKNFEKAISLCKGDYIALADQDDIWTNNHLEVLINIIGDNYLACGNALIVDRVGESKEYDLIKLEKLDVIPETNIDFAYRIFLCGNPLQGACMLLKRNFLEKSLPIPEGVGYHDAWFAAVASIQNKLSYTSTIINRYRQHGENVTSVFNKDKNIIIKNLIFKIKSKSKGGDRLYYYLAIKERFNFNDLSKESVQFLDKIYWYYDNLSKGENRLKLALFRFKNYSKIYSTKSKKLYIPRLIKFLIKSQ